MARMGSPSKTQLLVVIATGMIWVGTDDGKVQLTQNAGGAWTDLTPALTAAGAPVDRWVSRVFASPHDAVI